jgi:S-DNA-T family DNA segregation ATPase FtsK/SpoIIIE
VVELTSRAAALHHRDRPPQSFTADRTDPGWARRVAAALRDLRDATPAPAQAAQLPRHLDLLTLIETDPARIADGWLAACARPEAPGLRAVLGRRAEGPWHVDLVADGPHVVVAGTTGAGKSELLTSLVASLATGYPPERLSLLLVDYKGGTAFSHLADVPHVAGVVTDLDGAAARRALTSLFAELRHRERRLTAGGHAPARLVIVVDEFRVLAEEQPDLLAGLIRVATVGRGLGVHLVLATQRPAGAISADIRANTNLRIAMRVRDRADSEDVLDVPHAAAIDADTPGRALVRAGGGEPVAVQVARLAPEHRERWLTAVAAAGRLIGSRPPPAPWLPPLPASVTAAELAELAEPARPDEESEGPGGPADDGLAYALADLPQARRRVVVTWAPGDGHLAVVGGPRSGRTTTLRTLAAAAGGGSGTGRGAVPVHVVDAAGDLADLAEAGIWPHVGTVVGVADTDRADRLLTLLSDLASRRGGGRGGEHRVLLLVDGWESLAAEWSRTEAGRRVEDLLRLARDGSSAGLRLAVAGGRGLLSGAASSLFGDRLVLPAVDPHLALLAGVPADRRPAGGVAGRGLHLRGSRTVEIQVASPAPGPFAAPSEAPLRLRPLPDRVRLADLPPAGADVVPLGLGGDGAEVVGLPAADCPGLLVCGPPGSGRSATLVGIAGSLAAGNRSALLVCPGPHDWRPGPGVEVLRPGPEHGDPAGAIEGRLRADPATTLLLDTGWANLPGVEEVAVRHLRAAGARSGNGGPAVVVAAEAVEVAVAFRGLTAELRALRCGVLLGPRQSGDGEAVGIRVGAAAWLPPGRGVLAVRGRATPVQVAHPAHRGDPG